MIMCDWKGSCKAVITYTHIYTYLTPFFIHRAGLAEVVEALGVGEEVGGGGGDGAGWGETASAPHHRLPLGLDLPPECVRRLLCEVHRKAAPKNSHRKGYSLLPFWT